MSDKKCAELRKKLKAISKKLNAMGPLDDYDPEERYKLIHQEIYLQEEIDKLCKQN